MILTRKKNDRSDDVDRMHCVPLVPVLPLPLLPHHAALASDIVGHWFTPGSILLPPAAPASAHTPPSASSSSWSSRSPSSPSTSLHAPPLMAMLQKIKISSQSDNDLWQLHDLIHHLGQQHGYLLLLYMMLLLPIIHPSIHPSSSCSTTSTSQWPSLLLWSCSSLVTLTSLPYSFSASALPPSSSIVLTLLLLHDLMMPPCTRIVMMITSILTLTILIMRKEVWGPPCTQGWLHVFYNLAP